MTASVSTTGTDADTDANAGTNAGADARLTLDYLLRRMRSKQDFPALSASISRVQALSESDSESLHTLCDEILQDVALTQKLLRVVNTAHYRRAGTDPIRTVSRAVSLIGVAGVRNLALSLVLLDHMHDQVHAAQLKEAFLQTVMAGTLASELGATPAEAEEAFVGTLFRRLGWLLVAFYLPEDAEQMRELMRATQPVLSEAQAAQQVLGVRLDELADAIGAQWGLPEALRACMRAPQGALPAHSLAGTPERLHWLASLAEAATDAMLHTPPADLGEALVKLHRSHARTLDLAPQALQDAAGRARKRLSELTAALNLSVPAASPAERLLDTYYVDAPDAVGTAPGTTPSTTPSTAPSTALGTAAQPHLDIDLAHTGFTDLGAGELGPPALSPTDILTSGIQDITNTLVEAFSLQSVLHMVLETLYRGLDARRVVFCLRDARTGELQGRMGLGEGAELLKAAFQVPLSVASGAQPDLFTAVSLKNADTLIADARLPAVARLLPRWFTTHIDAQTFLLLPLVLKRAGQPDRVIGLIYADKAAAGSLSLDERTLSLLRTLRNQAIMAFKQSA